MLKKKLLALTSAFTVLTLAIVSVLPTFVSADPTYKLVEGSGTVVSANWDVTITHAADNVKKINLSEFGITEDDTINKVVLTSTAASNGEHKFNGVLGVSAVEGAGVDGLISADANSIPYNTTDGTLTFELPKEETENVWSGVDSVLQVGYWWGDNAEITISKVDITINGEYEEVEGPAYTVELQGGEVLSYEADKVLNQAEASKAQTLDITLGNFGISEDFTVNKIEVDVTEDTEGTEYHQFTGIVGVSAKEDYANAAGGLVTDGQKDYKDGSSSFTITFDLTEEQSAGVWTGTGSKVHIAYYFGPSQTVTIGEIRITVNGEYVHVPTEAGDNSQYLDYATALQAALYIYDANMCGPYAEEYSALAWRDDCHIEDIYDITIDGVTYEDVDLNGGYHDAGDHVKFGLPAAYSAFTLGLAYNQFQDAFDSTSQTSHLQTITDYFTDYFKKCLIYDESGKVVSFVYQVGDGTDDHRYWDTPENQGYASAPGLGEDPITDSYRPVMFTDPKNLNADIIGGTIAALAMNYINFGTEEDLQAANDLYAYINQYADIIIADTSDDTDDLNIVSTVPEYARWEDATNQNNPWDYLSLGAITLNLATNSTDYDTFNDPKNVSAGKSYFPANWDGVWPYYQILAEQYSGAIARSIPGVGKEYTNDFNFVQKWGSARMNANLQFTALMLDKNMGATTYQEWARGQMDYLFGKNTEKQAFMVGYNFREDVSYPKYPHHRAADGTVGSPGAWSDEPYNVTADGWSLKDDIPTVTRTQKNVLIGALVGGPEDASGAYVDVLNNYYGNEVAIDYQAGFIGALAGLFLAYQNNGTDSIITDPKLLADGVQGDYFGAELPDRTLKTTTTTLATTTTTTTTVKADVTTTANITTTAKAVTTTIQNYDPPVYPAPTTNAPVTTTVTTTDETATPVEGGADNTNSTGTDGADATPVETPDNTATEEPDDGSGVAGESDNPKTSDTSALPVVLPLLFAFIAIFTVKSRKTF
ncbi:MAG: glycoside hydrolase family 9 protein [Oscillospiraceae bacterium]|jgi:hypothetical protein|nr:glycoside hydrolase family 9 protein [Oscillospiraceae bacterium]